MSSSEDDSDIDQNQSTQRGIDVNSGDIQTIITDVVQYVITKSQKKLPIKKADISKDCLQRKGRQFNQILHYVNEDLDKYFGMTLKEVPNKKVPQYILVNILDIVEIPYFDKNSEDYTLNGILIPVLSVIFMLKGEVKEDIIWNFLKTLGLDEESNSKLSPLNYTLKQLLTSVWVKQLYLDYYKQGEGEDKYNVFDWGFRSVCEVDKRMLLKFVSSVYDASVCPETWHEQFALANAIVSNQ